MMAATADSHEIVVDDTSNEDAASTTATTNLNEITVVLDIWNDDAAESTAAKTADLIEIKIDRPKELNEIDILYHISNYDKWKGEMENYLKTQGLWGVVDGSESKPQESVCFRSNEYSTNWKVKDMKALEAVEMKLGRVLRRKYHLSKFNSAKEAWGMLSAIVSCHLLGSPRASKMLETALGGDDAESDTNGRLEDASNYVSWKVIMEFKLRSQDLWGVIDGTIEPPSYICSYSSKYSIKDRKALGILKGACGFEMSNWIKHARSAKFAWARLSRANILHKATYNEMAATTIDLHEVLAGDISNDESWKGLDEIILVDIKNYNTWRIYMEKYLRSQHLWNVVNGSEFASIGKDMKAYRAIKMACGPNMQYFLARYKDRYGANDPCPSERAWKQLRDAYTAHIGIYLDEKVILTTKNYESWKGYMRSVLRGRYMVWGREETCDYYDFYVSFPRKILNFYDYDIIKSSCSPEMLPHIMFTEDPREALKQLEDAEASSPEEKERYCKMVAASREAQVNIDEVKKANEEHLTKSNYKYFILYLKQLLMSRYLWDIVDGSHQPTFRNFSVWKIKNKAALGLIKSNCGPDIVAHAQRTQFAQKAWYELARGAGDSPEEKDPYTRYLPLYKLLEKDESIFGSLGRDFLGDFPEATCHRITDDGITLLHSSIMQGKLVFGRDLIHFLSEEQLEIKTDKGQLAISLAVEYNNMELVKLMVDKNSKLLLLENENGHIPFYTSAINGDQEMMRYLYSKTPIDMILSSNTLGDKDGANLITAALRVELYDVALDLLKRLPGLATIEDNNGMTVFQVLSAKPSAFPSGHHLGFFEKRIYGSAGVSRNGIIGKALTAIVPYVNQLSDEKVKHDQAVQIVKTICPQLSGLDKCDLDRIGAYDAIYSTTVHGIVEFFTMLTNSNPNLIHFKDGAGNGLYQHSVISRQVKIFKLISQMGQQKQGTELSDNNKNNILHCAAFWRPSSLSNVSGAALQMQRELQLFQEVEKVVNLKYREMKNKKGTKPKALFTQQHKTLVKEGEKWIKEASQACMVVSTLIATVMFAAAFTVPGGNDQNTGIPIFLSSRAFLVFVVSDAVSLFASCTSVLMFFTLLTARYAEHDFMMSLPRKLILGLFFLFLSIAFMMAAFAATLVLVLHEKVPWVYAPVICLAIIPVVLFGALQFPLFYDIVRSTFGRGYFYEKQPSTNRRRFQEFSSRKLQDYRFLPFRCWRVVARSFACILFVCCGICSEELIDDRSL